MTDTDMSTHTGTTGSDDFLASIQDAEIQAAEIVSDAETKKTKDLNAYRQQLKTEQTERIETYRQESKQFLSEQARKSTMECEAETKKAAKDAEKFYSDKETDVKPLLKEAFTHLLGLVKN